MIVTQENFVQAVKSLSGSAKISLDTETTGLSEKDRPFSVNIANETTACYFDERLLSKAHIKEAIYRTQASRMVMQNAKFDMRMCLMGWDFNEFYGSIEDTEVLGRLVRNDHLKYNLDIQAKRYGMAKSDIVKKYVEDNKLYTEKKHPFKKEKVKLLHYDRVPIEIMAPYALQDARVTYDLHTKLEADLDPKSQPVWDMEKKLTKVCFAMERRGILLRKDYCIEAMAYEERCLQEAKNHFHMATGVLFDNKKNTLVTIFKNAGEEIPKTLKGNDSLTDDILNTFTSPAAKIVQKIRFHEQRIGNYYSNFLDLVDESGLIHPDMRQAGTTTGRFSYRDPNLQNLSKEEDSTDPYLIRGCFGPRPGYVLVSMDYKQMEYRLMLDYANHWKLIEQINAGADIHQAMADMMGISRTEAKTLNFAILYGAGLEKVAAMLGISMGEADFLKQRYFAKLLAVKMLISKITSTGKGRGFVYNWLGRKLHINSSEFAYALPNHLIQGGGADICKVAMVQCFPLLSEYDCHMVLQVHDALYFEMKKEDMGHLIPKLKKTMIDAYTPRNGMYMDVDVKWSETSMAERDLQKWISE